MTAKPGLGKSVFYYDPKIVQRIGYIDGYEGGGMGPYHAVVLNDRNAGLTLEVHLPGAAVLQFRGVLGKDDPALGKDAAYWEWTDNLAKARAEKAAAAAALKEVTEV